MAAPLAHSPRHQHLPPTAAAAIFLEELGNWLRGEPVTRLVKER